MCYFLLNSVNKQLKLAHSRLKPVYGDECLSRIQAFKWYKRFKEDRDEIGDDIIHVHDDLQRQLHKNISKKSAM